jgi:ABC-2 type transport system ATP-binding protein
VVVEFEKEISLEEIRAVDSVLEVIMLSSGVYRIVPERDKDIRPGIFRFAADKNLSLVGLKQEENSLESIFQELTR